MVNPEIGEAQVSEDASGRLLIGGGSAGELVAARYLPDGRLDPSFGADGLARIALPGFGPKPAASARVDALAIQPDGKLLIGGSFVPEPGTGLGPNAVLARLDADGALDAGFGGSRAEGGRPGLVILPAREAITAIAPYGGKILVGGTAGRGFVGRYNPDGRLDRSFGGGRLGGWLSLPPRPQGRRQSSAEAGVEGLLTGPHGMVYAAGYANGKFMLARLRRDGHLDPHFGMRGVVAVDAAARHACRCSMGQGLARDGQGRLLVSGSVLSRHRGAPRAIAVVRFTPGGILDRSFGQAGVARTNIGAETWGGPLAIQPGGRIVVAGATAARPGGPYRFALLAYRPNGRRDRSFFGDGIFSARFSARFSEAADLLVDRRARLVVTGGTRFEGGQPEALLTRFAPCLGGSTTFSSSAPSISTGS